MEITGGQFSADATGLQTVVERYGFNTESEAMASIAGYADAQVYQDASLKWIAEIKTHHLQGSGGSGNSPTSPAPIVEEIRGVMKQEPIETHPWFLLPGGIRDKYGYNDALKAFPETMPESTSSNIQQSRDKVSKKNPLYMTTSFMAISMLYVKSQTVTSLGNVSGLYHNIGRISSPQTVLLSLPVFANRNWLKLSPSIQALASRSQGYVFKVSQQWQLSGPGGWNNIIYKPFSENR